VRALVFTVDDQVADGDGRVLDADHAGPAVHATGRQRIADRCDGGRIGATGALDGDVLVCDRAAGEAAVTHHHRVPAIGDIDGVLQGRAGVNVLAAVVAGV